MLGYDIREAARDNAAAALYHTRPKASPLCSLWCTDSLVFASFHDASVLVYDLRKPSGAPLLLRLGAQLSLSHDGACLSSCVVSTATSMVRMACVFRLDDGTRLLRVSDFLPAL